MLVVEYWVEILRKDEIYLMSQILRIEKVEFSIICYDNNPAMYLQWNFCF